MPRHPRTTVTAVLFSLASLSVLAQSPAPEFEVVSIKRSQVGLKTASMRFLPDGTLVMVNQPLSSVIMMASPVKVREVVGLPNWVETETYDLTAKPPADSTAEQRGEMLRKMFADRMKLVAHVEERERASVALVVDRSDGRLGPQLTRSVLDCSPRPAGSPPRPRPSDPSARCELVVGPTVIVGGSITMDQLASLLGDYAGALVNNRTGLQGNYAVKLMFSQERGAGPAADTIRADDLPTFVTALREQLGLRLVPEKTIVPVFVIDSIERPSEN